MLFNGTLPQSAQPPASSYYLLRNTILLNDVSTLPGITPKIRKLGPPISVCDVVGGGNGVRILSAIGQICCPKGRCEQKVPTPTPRRRKDPPHRPVHPRRCTGQESSAFACNPQPDITGVTSGGSTPWLEYALIGGAGYIGYKAYKKHKATGKWF